MNAHQVDIHIGNRLRLARDKIGMSRKDLCEAVSLHPSQLYKYEQGINRIPSSRLWQFARALNIKPGWFFDELQNNL